MTTALTGLPRAFSPYGVGSYIRFFDTQTDTPKDVYSDADLETVIADADLVADSASTFPVIFLQQSLYRIKVYNSSNVLKYMVDDFDPALAAGFGVSSLVGVAQGGTGAANAAAARANLSAASSTALTSTQNDVTELQTQVATGLNESDEFGALASKDAVEVDDLAASFGLVCIQRDRYTTLANSTITTATPAYDSSKPQISEGDQVFSRAFTPLRDDSVIRVTFYFTSDVNAASQVVFAIFKNSTADAVAADAFRSIASSTAFTGGLVFEESSGSTSSRTYSVRGGTASGTITLNGSNTLGGLRQCYLLIEEWVTK
jgi:hypothetical protein